MIDVAAIGALLAPALPYLLKSADQAATALGEKGLPGGRAARLAERRP